MNLERIIKGFDKYIKLSDKELIHQWESLERESRQYEVSIENISASLDKLEQAQNQVWGKESIYNIQE